MHRKQSKGWVRKDEDGERILVKEDSPLHAIKYHRVILDEAHSIKVSCWNLARRLVSDTWTEPQQWNCKGVF